MLWTHLFAPNIPWPATAALGLAVWMLYVADRLLDAHRNRTLLEERHRFHHAHRKLLLTLLIVAAPILITLMAHVDSSLRYARMSLALPLALYLITVHLSGWRMPKELAVAIFFSAACATPAVLSNGILHTLPHAILFAMLCLLNCAAIAQWEARSEAEWQAMHPLVRFIAQNLSLLGTALILCSAATAFLTRSYAIPFVCVVSALLLATANTERKRLSRLTLRATADAALLTPILLLIMQKIW